jgi:hypothetical protein
MERENKNNYIISKKEKPPKERLPQAALQVPNLSTWEMIPVRDVFALQKCGRPKFRQKDLAE